MSKTRELSEAISSKEDDLNLSLANLSLSSTSNENFSDDHPEVRVSSGDQSPKNQEKLAEDELSIVNLSLATLSLSNTQNESSSDDDSLTEDYHVQIVGNANAGHTF